MGTSGQTEQCALDDPGRILVVLLAVCYDIPQEASLSLSQLCLRTCLACSAEDGLLGVMQLYTGRMGLRQISYAEGALSYAQQLDWL